MSEDHLSVTYQGYVLTTRIPFLYEAVLYVDDLPTGISTRVWTLARAKQAMQTMVRNGNELINQYGVAAGLAAELYARRREEAMAKVQVGDSVKLLVDIGQFKKGRVCKVAAVPEPSFYEARGGIDWDDDRYILVHPVQSPTDQISLGPKDSIPLRRGEFGPLDMEVEE